MNIYIYIYIYIYIWRERERRKTNLEFLSITKLQDLCPICQFVIQEKLHFDRCFVITLAHLWSTSVKNNDIISRSNSNSTVARCSAITVAIECMNLEKIDIRNLLATPKKVTVKVNNKIIYINKNMKTGKKYSIINMTTFSCFFQ